MEQYVYNRLLVVAVVVTALSLVRLTMKHYTQVREEAEREAAAKHTLLKARLDHGQSNADTIKQDFTTFLDGVVKSSITNLLYWGGIFFFTTWAITELNIWFWPYHWPLKCYNTEADWHRAVFFGACRAIYELVLGIVSFLWSIVSAVLRLLAGSLDRCLIKWVDCVKKLANRLLAVLRGYTEVLGLQWTLLMTDPVVVQARVTFRAVLTHLTWFVAASIALVWVGLWLYNTIHASWGQSLKTLMMYEPASITAIRHTSLLECCHPSTPTSISTTIKTTTLFDTLIHPETTTLISEVNSLGSSASETVTTTEYVYQPTTVKSKEEEDKDNTTAEVHSSTITETVIEEVTTTYIKTSFEYLVSTDFVTKYISEYITSTQIEIRPSSTVMTTIQTEYVTISEELEHSTITIAEGSQTSSVTVLKEIHTSFVTVSEEAQPSTVTIFQEVQPSTVTILQEVPQNTVTIFREVQPSTIINFEQVRQTLTVSINTLPTSNLEHIMVNDTKDRGPMEFGPVGYTIHTTRSGESEKCHACNQHHSHEVIRPRFGFRYKNDPRPTYW